MIYKTIDLCAGIGGIRRGFELTKHFQNVLSAEIDPYAALTYRHLFGDDPTNDLTTEEFKRTVVNTDYDVLLAGFPCQTFSRVGKQLGFRDTTRGTIFFDLADIISRTNPRAVFLENVENLVSHDKGNTIGTIIKTLEDELEYRVIGVQLDEDGNYVYNTSTLVRNSKYFGVPQNRPRVYIMAFSKKIYGKAVKLLNKQLPKNGDRTIYANGNDILEENVDDHYYMAQGYLDTLKKHRERQKNSGNGFGYCVVNEAGKKQWIANTIMATGGSGKERNLVYQPKEGVGGKKLCNKKTRLNSEGIRVMTPTEWGRLQGFIGYGFINEDGIDTFSFPENVTDSKKYMQFGNSVTIPVIEKMAEFMVECFSLLEDQQVEVVKSISNNKPFFFKREVMEILDLNSAEASKLLHLMINQGEIRVISRGKTSRYMNDQNFCELPPFNQEEKVVKFVAKNGITTNKDIQSELNMAVGSTNAVLSNLTKKGVLIRCSRGHYRLKKIENTVNEAITN